MIELDDIRERVGVLPEVTEKPHLDTQVDDLAGTITLTVHADAPAVAPGLPRTIRHRATATHERWLP